MNRLTNTLAVAGLTVLLVTSSCNKEPLPDNSIVDENPGNSLARLQLGHYKLKKQLVTGLGGGWGSTIGPGGDLYVPDGNAGAILRVDPKTGDYTTFASGLPQLIPEVGIGGISDVAFVCGKAYALVTLVDDPLFPTGQVNGIYRIDGPNTFKVIADIGAYNLSYPPSGFPIDVLTGVLYAMEPYKDGFLVTDGHFNRVLYVTLDGTITVIRRFTDIVPTGLAVRGNQVYLAQAGPVPHLPENGKVVTFNSHSPAVTTVASGAPLVTDVEFGRGKTIFALSQGDYSGEPEGSPALPNTGSLVKVNDNGTFSVIADGLDRPTSFEIIRNTAYVITLGGEIWTINNIAGPSYGRSHQKHLLHHHR